VAVFRSLGRTRDPEDLFDRQAEGALELIHNYQLENR
jgi:hypothetical protein